MNIYKKNDFRRFHAMHIPQLNNQNEKQIQEEHVMLNCAHKRFNCSKFPVCIGAYHTSRQAPVKLKYYHTTQPHSEGGRIFAYKVGQLAYKMINLEFQQMFQPVF
ncbi:Hypothetical_protein [Hexamita inflata]|uniref:Hypothetical_protein n=1 Tax=Hexamita inflata TaxID=28002 RepID=A0AA86QD04_9EUKA|nr:Hypothetical protein HINF_LOCUS40238 [Hexamita inflata]